MGISYSVIKDPKGYPFFTRDNKRGLISSEEHTWTTEYRFRTKRAAKTFPEGHIDLNSQKESRKAEILEVA